MIVELVNTGTELMLGRTLNTHQQWICRQMADAGYVVSRQIAIPDQAEVIQQTVRECLSRADLVIVTGGLGPTSDDLTRELIASLLGTPLRADAAVLARIQEFFTARNRPLSPGAHVQSMVPEGAVVLPNHCGTAPGLVMKVCPNAFRPEGKASWLVMLPGPPRELRPMFKDTLLPWLSRTLPPAEAFVCRTLRATGIGESQVEHLLSPGLRSCVADGLELGYCAHVGQVDIRLVARGTEADAIVSEAEGIVRSHIGAFLYGDSDEQIEETVVRLLTARKETLAVAESCTGGCLSHRITNVPGASHVFLAGLTTYSNKAKQRFLGVKAVSLDERGAVSDKVAREMAEGARSRTRATYALSVTGIAGPSGGTQDKPVGTVFIGLAGLFETIVDHNLNPFDRETFKAVTSQQAMEMLRRAIQSRAFAED
jgi:nicotinamide-nucleotide amidase